VREGLTLRHIDARTQAGVAVFKGKHLNRFVVSMFR